MVISQDLSRDACVSALVRRESLSLGECRPRNAESPTGSGQKDPRRAAVILNGQPNPRRPSYLYKGPRDFEPTDVRETGR